jgi:putative DNA primase/helicase
LRTYEKRPTEIVTDARGLYVAACLTIVRAYRAALERGEAKSVSPKLASFEDWSDNVRSALVWLGEADPVESMTQARENDPALAARRAIVSAWAAICGAEAMTIADAVEQSDRARLNCDDDLDDPMPDLKAILMEHAGTVGGKFDNRRAGSFLRTIAGAVVDGRRLVKVKSRDTSKPVMWRVETVTK